MIRISPISTHAYHHALTLRDLTDAAYGQHAMQYLVADAIQALQSAWKSPAIIHRRPPVVSVQDNYDDLLYPADNMSRDIRYTRYRSDSTLLRTHTSALIPGVLRSLADDPPDDILLACPGLVYRRDVIDALHTGEPHQCDLWRLVRGSMNEDDLLTMIDTVVGALLPGYAYRINHADHPYTIHGREVEVQVADRWVEIGECGLANPEVYRRCGIPESHSGLAMGIGLDRVLMIRKGIDDIRLLRSTDSRVVDQMRDLHPYRSVSSLPAIRRDMSVCRQDLDDELLGDIVRDVLGDRVEWIEHMQILSRTPVEDLPEGAWRRMGPEPGQVNLLVQVILRHPTETLTDEVANQLRDDIYERLHEGSVHEWCAR